jgi:hypothetical protein
LTFFINALSLKPVCIIGQNGADFHSGTTNVRENAIVLIQKFGAAELVA